MTDTQFWTVAWFAWFGATVALAMAVVLIRERSAK